MSRNKQTDSKYLLDKPDRNASQKRDTKVKYAKFDMVYPKCVADKFARPELSKREIAGKYCTDCGLSINSFMKLMGNNGWEDVEEELKRGKKKDTALLIDALRNERKERGLAHLGKMMEYVDDAHETVSHSVSKYKEDRELAAKELPRHLSNLESLGKIGESAFGLSEDKEISKPVVNLAILVGLDPQLKRQ